MMEMLECSNEKPIIMPIWNKKFSKTANPNHGVLHTYIYRTP